MVQIEPMDPAFVGMLVASHLAAILLTALWCSARARWQRGRGLARRPAVVAVENGDRLRKAHAERTQGWREMGRAVGQIALIVSLVFVLSFLLGGTVRW